MQKKKKKKEKRNGRKRKRKEERGKKGEKGRRRLCVCHFRQVHGSREISLITCAKGCSRERGPGTRETRRCLVTKAYAPLDFYTLYSRILRGYWGALINDSRMERVKARCVRPVPASPRVKRKILVGASGPISVTYAGYA